MAVRVLEAHQEEMPYPLRAKDQHAAPKQPKDRPEAWYIGVRENYMQVLPVEQQKISHQRRRCSQKRDRRDPSGQHH
jgi:hypothetical protein